MELWHGAAVGEWLRQHGFDPSAVYRVDVRIDYREALAVMTVHRYRLNADGQKYLDGDDIAVEAPETRRLLSLPPVLWTGLDGG